jgi:osmotically-inducible protein OsmY
MSQTVDLLPLPPPEHSDRENEAPETAAELPTQSLEDIRLGERVERALHAAGYGSLRTVAVSVRARVVVLLGRVSSYHLKQVAQTTALAVPGARQIRNELQVVRPS